MDAKLNNKESTNISKSKKKKVIILSVVLVLVLAFVAIMIAGNQKASWYTNEQHLQRIQSKAYRRFVKHDNCDSIEVYPLYEKDGETMNYCLIVGYPTGSYYVKINDQFMYNLCPMYWVRPGSWMPQDIVEVNGQLEHVFRHDGKDYIYYGASPYQMANVLDQKLYALTRGDGVFMIPAIKQDGIFINLMTGKEVLFDDDGELYRYQEYIANVFYDSPYFLI